jgi:hypothetical protein
LLKHPRPLDVEIAVHERDRELGRQQVQDLYPQVLQSLRVSTAQELGGP